MLFSIGYPNSNSSPLVDPSFLSPTSIVYTYTLAVYVLEVIIIVDPYFVCVCVRVCVCVCLHDVRFWWYAVASDCPVTDPKALP